MSSYVKYWAVRPILTNGEFTDQQCDNQGRTIVTGSIKPYSDQCWSSSIALTTTSPVAIQLAAGAGLRRYVTGLQAINTGASPVDLIILDGAGERWRLPLPVNVPVSIQFPTELQATANTALNANLSAAGTVRANFQGYTGP